MAKGQTYETTGLKEAYLLPDREMVLRYDDEYKGVKFERCVRVQNFVDQVNLPEGKILKLTTENGHGILNALRRAVSVEAVEKQDEENKVDLVSLRVVHGAREGNETNLVSAPSLGIDQGYALVDEVKVSKNKFMNIPVDTERCFELSRNSRTKE